MHGWMRVNTTMKDKHLYLVDAACQHKGRPEIQQPRVWCKSPPPLISHLSTSAGSGVAELLEAV